MEMGCVGDGGGDIRDRNRDSDRVQVKMEMGWRWGWRSNGVEMEMGWGWGWDGMARGWRYGDGIHPFRVPVTLRYNIIGSWLMLDAS